MFKLKPTIFVAFFAFIMALAGPATEGKLITVDDDAPANYSIIQDAINFASDGDEIEVRPGTYYQTVNFKGKAVRLYSRDGSAVTIIDATGLNSSVVDCNSSEDANTILEGFTITGGNAVKGGGMHIIGSSPTVTNCIFTGNSADFGGGMYNNQWSGPTVNDCIFIGNIATQSGGGMYSNVDSNSIVNNCTFSHNEALGVAHTDGGGGMYNLNNSNPTVTNCTFSDNMANNSGGGIRDSNSSPAVTNCTFSYNSTTNDGGGMYNYLSNPTLVNCIFRNNTASYGGGMYNYDNSSPTVTNCTFNNNTVYNWGGGILNNLSSNPTLTNCILWDNVIGEIVDWDSPASTSTVSFSDVQGGWPGGLVVIDSNPLFVNATGGDLRLSSSASPCVDNGAISTPGLPATDLAGNPRVVDGDRNGTAIVDMGAYEYQSWLIHNITQDNWYETIQLAIDAAVTGDEIEVSPGTYYEAIDFKGKAIRLYSSDGSGVTTIDANGLDSSVVICNSGEDANTILEGFTITGGSGTTVGGYKYGGGMYNYSCSPTVTDCNFTTNSVTGDGGGMYNNQWSSPTVTNCNFAGNSAAYAGGGMDNRYDSSPMVFDCTFSGNTAGTYGGGMENNTRSNPTVTNCLFTENTATNSGGGLSNLNTSCPTVTNCAFRGNSVGVGYGGGMYNYNKSTPTVSNCTFSLNTAYINGGGVCNSTSSSPTISNCAFTGNTAGHYGGGMYNYASSPTVTNCIFNHNEAEQVSGGGIANYNGSHIIVTNCTFSGNSASYGGGIRNWESSPTVTNCILWDNERDEISSAGASAPVVNYSDIKGGHIGTGNINTDPNFTDANNPDPNLVNLRLLSSSPCIDAGDSTAVPSGIFLDLDGNPRGLDDPASPDTGVSVLGVTVDMGAYEFHPCPIAGDVNCDGVVDFKDVAILCGNWLAGTDPEL